jgi:DNA-binding LytR/AlgR family response regulator
MKSFRLLGWLGIGALAWAASAGAVPAAIPAGLVRVCPAQPGDTQPPSFDAADCQDLPLEQVDPQSRQLWLRKPVVLSVEGRDRALGLQISAKAASRAYLNGIAVGANGEPGDSAAAEIPGRMDVVLPLPRDSARIGENLIDLRLSSHHGWLHLSTPIHGVDLVPILDVQNEILRRYLPALLPLGAFLLAAFYFISLTWRSERKAVHALLSAMSVLAGMQLLIEISRGVFAYAYPVQDLRLIGILASSALFGLCLVAIAARLFLPPRARWPVWLGAALASGIGIASISGMDGKAGMALLTCTAIGAGVSAYGWWRRMPHARAHVVALLSFGVCIVLAREWFLDLYFFYLVAALLVFLMIQQAGAYAREMQLQREQRARAERLQAALDERAQVGSEVVLSVPGVGKLRRVSASSIAHVQGAGDYAELHLVGGESVLHTAGLNELEAELPNYFLRVHRSHLVNTKLIERLQQADGGTGTLILQNGKSVPVSRRIMPGVRKALR